MGSLGWAWSDRTGVLIGQGDEGTDTKGQPCEDTGGDGLYTPRREASGGTSPAHAWVSHLSPALCTAEILAPLYPTHTEVSKGKHPQELQRWAPDLMACVFRG